jgi:BlaI family transcriptional regulator, penicillinase repressor
VQISDAEWDVMLVLWQSGPKTAAEVISELAKTHDWNHRTIRTLLARLVEKKALMFESDGNRYLYGTAVTQADCVRQRSQSFLSKVFGGDTSALVAHFVEDARLSKTEIEELTQLLDAKKTSNKPKRKKK